MGNTRTAQFSEDGKRQLTWHVLLQPVQLAFFALWNEFQIWRVCVNFRLVSLYRRAKCFHRGRFACPGRSSASVSLFFAVYCEK